MYVSKVYEINSKERNAIIFIIIARIYKRNKKLNSIIYTLSKVIACAMSTHNNEREEIHSMIMVDASYNLKAIFKVPPVGET